MLRLHRLSILALAAALAILTSAAAEPMQPQCLKPTQVRSLVAAHPELTGASVRVGLVELSHASVDDPSGYAFMPNFEHSALAGADRGGLYFYDNPYRPVCYSAHASMVAAILFGDDPAAGTATLGPFHFRGIVPDAALSVYETNWFIYKRVIAPDAPAVDADVLNISWGTDANDVVTMWWQRGIDAMVSREKCVVVAACGNGGGELNGISKPSWGYNVISVGATRSLGGFPDYFSSVGPPAAEQSSFGPTSDGRSKPDIIAPGLSVGPSADSADGYYQQSAVGSSSFASAHVSGAAALLIDAARLAGIADGDDPRVIKAVLLNGADKLRGWHRGWIGSEDDHEAPLDYRQGAGMLNVASSYRQLMGASQSNSFSGRSGWLLDEVALDPDDDGAVKVYRLAAPAFAGDDIKATLVWYRHYGDGGVVAGLELSQLELELWAIDKAGELAERLDYSVSEIDNVQHIYYHCEQQREVALVVRGVGGELDAETFSLAFTTEQKNWAGDQLAGDVNVDGIVDAHDLMQWATEWMFARGDDSDYAVEDINCDGRVDQEDLYLLSQQWQQSSSWYQGELP